VVMDQASRGGPWQRTFAIVGIVSFSLSIWLIPAGFFGITPPARSAGRLLAPRPTHCSLECCSEEG